MSQFAGKTAVISGGAEGIGLSIAQALGDQKMNIVIADIDEVNSPMPSAPPLITAVFPANLDMFILLLFNVRLI